MEHIFYKKTNLLLVYHEEEGFSLFDVDTSFTKDGYKTYPVSFLPLFLPYLNVMEEAKLILTDKKVYTLDGQVITKIFKYDAKIEVLKSGNNWAVSMKNAYDEIRKLIIWDGEKVIGTYSGDKIVFNEDNVIVAEKLSLPDMFKFRIYHKGVLQSFVPNGYEVFVYKNTLICWEEKELAYSIADDKILCENVEGIFCSEDGNFLLIFDDNGNFSSHYKNKLTDIGGKYEFIYMSDTAEVFCLKKDNKYDLFEFSGKPIFKGVDDFSLSGDGASMVIKAGEKMIFLPC